MLLRTVYSFVDGKERQQSGEPRHGRGRLLRDIGPSSGARTDAAMVTAYSQIEHP